MLREYYWSGVGRSDGSTRPLPKGIIEFTDREMSSAVGDGDYIKCSCLCLEETTMKVSSGDCINCTPVYRLIVVDSQEFFALTTLGKRWGL